MWEKEGTSVMKNWKSRIVPSSFSSLMFLLSHHQRHSLFTWSDLPMSPSNPKIYLSYPFLLICGVSIPSNLHFSVTEQHFQRTSPEELDDYALSLYYLSKPRRNVTRALQFLRSMDDPRAICKLGELYLLGSELSQNISYAIQLINTSASFGNAHCQEWIAFWYSSINESISWMWYQLAVMGGSKLAEMATAFRYLHGISVPKSCLSATANCIQWKIYHMVTRQWYCTSEWR